MNYLSFVEEHKSKENNIFDKIMTVAARAKDLTEDKMPLLSTKSFSKPTSIALLEYNQKLIKPKIEQIDTSQLSYKDDEMDLE